MPRGKYGAISCLFSTGVFTSQSPLTKTTGTSQGTGVRKSSPTSGLGQVSALPMSDAKSLGDTHLTDSRCGFTSPKLMCREARRADLCLIDLSVVVFYWH